MSVCSYWKKKPQHCTTFAAKKKAPMVLLLLMAPAADEGQKTFPHKRRKKFFVFPIMRKFTYLSPTLAQRTLKSTRFATSAQN
jgi:hypothetical protein